MSEPAKCQSASEERVPGDEEEDDGDDGEGLNRVMVLVKGASEACNSTCWKLTAKERRENGCVWLR